MYNETLKKIETMIRASEILDQKGLVEESGEMLYNAFEVAEQEVYRMAEELNNMTKTASKNDRIAKLQELENMEKTAKMIATAAITGWLDEAGKWLKKPFQNAGKWIGKKLKGGAHALDAPILKKLETNPEYLEKGLLPKTQKGLENASTWATNNPGKAGAIGIGAAGLGGVGAYNALKPNKAEGQVPIGVDGIAPQRTTSIPSGTAPLGSYPIQTSGGPAGAPMGAPGAAQASAQMSAIEGRIKNLEDVVQAIRVKVGV